MKGCNIMNTKVIYYRGIKFTKSENADYFSNGRFGYLHRFVWLCERGEIPKGFQIHHIDNNKENNDISNLMLVSVKRHRSLHEKPKFSEESRQVLRDNINKNREKLNKYHSSEEGRKQKSETAKKLWAEGKMTKPNTYICEICGKEYIRRSKPANHRFCSYECQRVYEKTPEERICCICGKTYTSFIGSSSKTCSRSCSVKLNHKNRRN